MMFALQIQLFFCHRKRGTSSTTWENKKFVWMLMTFLRPTAHHSRLMLRAYWFTLNSLWGRLATCGCIGWQALVVKGDFWLVDECQNESSYLIGRLSVHNSDLFKRLQMWEPLHLLFKVTCDTMFPSHHYAALIVYPLHMLPGAFLYNLSLIATFRIFQISVIVLIWSSVML